MRMRIFTLVWGSYIDWFEQALVKSLRWPRNLAALREYASEWNLYCRQNEIDRLRAELAAAQTVIAIKEAAERGEQR